MFFESLFNNEYSVMATPLFFYFAGQTFPARMEVVVHGLFSVRCVQFKPLPVSQPCLGQQDRLRQGASFGRTRPVLLTFLRRARLQSGTEVRLEGALQNSVLLHANRKRKVTCRDPGRSPPPQSALTSLTGCPPQRSSIVSSVALRRHVRQMVCDQATAADARRKTCRAISR